MSCIVDHAAHHIRDEIPRRLIEQCADGVQFEQVLFNLVLNAADAMPEGGSLSIATSRSRDQIRVTVTDTGAGIPAHVLPRIFDPFFTTKNDPSMTPEGSRKGTGLGLAVSYGIVREHGGEIEVESTVGKGTRFLLTFPLKHSAPVSRPVPAREPALTGSEAPLSVLARTDFSTTSVPATYIARSDRSIY